MKLRSEGEGGGMYSVEAKWDTHSEAQPSKKSADR
jgi:hypothetical protein